MPAAVVDDIAVFPAKRHGAATDVATAETDAFALAARAAERMSDNHGRERHAVLVRENSPDARYVIRPGDASLDSHRPRRPLASHLLLVAVVVVRVRLR